MSKILYTENGQEFYLNPDGKIISRPIDRAKNYRIQELSSQVKEVLDKARSMDRIPLEKTIDYLIELQKESTEKAYKYACYRFLGTVQHKDVFGKEAAQEYDNEKKWKEINDLKRTVMEMKKQQDEMHRLLINMAKYMNTEKRSFQKANY